MIINTESRKKNYFVQVKENREKRQKELERQRREKQAKKDAEFQARQEMKRVRLILIDIRTLSILQSS